jgi:hypothetical protein
MQHTPDGDWSIYKAIARRKEKDYRRRLVASGRASRPYGSLGDDPLALMILTPRFERAEREFLPARMRRRIRRSRLALEQAGGLVAVSLAETRPGEQTPSP